MADNFASRIPPDLGDKAVRRQLGPAAWKFFGRLIQIWQVPEDEARQLLGLNASINLDNLDQAQLGEEQMLRVLYRTELADQWVRLPNSNVIFNGQTPLAYMAHGGIEALRNVRRLLDARCAGK